MTTAGLDALTIRRDFPVLDRHVHGRPLVYLDNAATSQKPRAVIDAVQTYYETYNANIHRGIHTLSEQSTAAYEDARARIAAFINAARPHELTFTRGTTESINLVARAWGDANVGAGDEILLTEIEHHSNLVPWQMLAQRRGAKLRYIPTHDSGLVDLDAYARMFGPRTRIVAVTHMSNVLGTIMPVKAMIATAHRHDVPVLLDGAQSVPHLPVDVQDLNVDFLAFSGHKMLGPTGIGALYGKEALLEAMEPLFGGGSMIGVVELETSTWAGLPDKFEGGTPNIVGAIGLGVAVDYLQQLGMPAVRAHEIELTEYALRQLEDVAGLDLYGPEASSDRGGVVAFNVDGIHPHDVGTVLDADGIAVRAGHHCAQPLMRKLGVAATARASFYVYNQASEVDALVRGLERVKGFFGNGAG